MNRKKVSCFFVLGILAINIMAGLVSAGPTEDLIAGGKAVIGGIFEIFKPVFEIIIGPTESGTFLGKLLFLVIIFSIIWVSLSKVDFFYENLIVLWVISIAASILAIRWFGNSEIVQTAILPYSALGIAISAGLPFVLYFLIVKNFKSSLARKTAWIFFAVIFTGLWIIRYGTSAQPDNFVELPSEGGIIGNFSFIYLITALLSLAMAFFDGTIQKFFAKARAERSRAGHTSRLIDRLRDDIKDADKRLAEGDITPAEHGRRVGEANRKLKKLIK